MAAPNFPAPREVYDPQEDSKLLLEKIEGLSGKRACDMGTGSGILAKKLAKSFAQVIAVDVNPEAGKVEFPGNVEFVKGNLFSRIAKRENFDLIVFNSPYLPGYEDRRWSCGEGEVLVEFLKSAEGHLEDDGKILFLISSLTPKIVSATARKLYRVEVVGEARLPGFETLFVLRLCQKKAFP
ncbi:MAG: methyltransferase [archaeon]